MGAAHARNWCSPDPLHSHLGQRRSTEVDERLYVTTCASPQRARWSSLEKNQIINGDA
jgi:hypothetical protein